MRQQTARINVTLPTELIESVDQIAGPRSRSRLIAESIREHIRQMKKDELEKQLEEGYRATATEGIVIARGFEAVDLEGWDDY
jgi:metal-responsive CopG/Arc/MetJ family transcriptional regulator